MERLTKCVETLIAIFSVPTIVLNLLSGVVSFIWLGAILGEWGMLGYGFVLSMIAPSALGLAVMPTMVFILPLALLPEKGVLRVMGLVVSGLLSNLYTAILVTLWACSVFYYFVDGSTNSNAVPHGIWSYSVAVGPLGYLASKDGGTASKFSLMTTSAAYCVVLLIFVIRGLTMQEMILTMLAFQLLGFVLLVSVAIPELRKELRS